MPAQVAGLTNIVNVAAGLEFSLFLDGSGSIWGIGRNDVGQLGNGTTVNSPTPVQVAGITNAVAISSSYSHSLALLSDGTVVAWGDNTYGQLGDGTNTNASVPVAVSGLSNVAQVAAGAGFSLARLNDGTVRAWGLGIQGQLGNGSQSNQSTPVSVSGISTAVDVAAGHSHAAAALADGRVFCWGSNSSGQLGDGTTNGSSTPVQTSGIATATDVAAGGGHTLARLSDGTVRAWGWNFYGQLGNGTTTDALTPVAVAGLTDALSVAACNAVSFALAGLTGTSVVATHAKGQPGQTLSIEAQLLASGTPLAGRSLDVTIDGSPAGTYVTDANGRVSLSYTILESDAYDAKYVLFSFAGDMLLPGSSGAGAFIGTPGQTTTWTIDRTGVMTDLTYLRAWLRRVWDGTYLPGRSIQFRIDGVTVGSEVTDANGRATLPWIITDGPTTRVIEARFQGDSAYQMSSGTATLTAQTIETKTFALDRTQRIARSVLLRGYLRRKVANTPIEGKSLEFSVDGTSVGKVLTGPTGRADQWYVVPEGSGAGIRPILVEWAGDSGYLPSSYTADLNVQRATVYIWPLVRSVAQGTPATLKAYLRRMPDYVALSDKDLSFSIDGTHVGTAKTASFPLSSVGWATLTGVDTSGLAIGVHSGSVSFAGDAFYEPGSSPFSINIL